MKVLITGGCGFIGINFAKSLLRDGHDVILLDNLSRRGSEKNLESILSSSFAKGQLRFVHGDLRTDLQIIRPLVEEVEVIYHLAAQVAVTTSIQNPTLDFQVNALGTFNLLEIVRNSQTKPALIFASTNKVYGNLEVEPVTESESRYQFQDLPHGVHENFPLDFHSPYGCSKGTADQYVLDYARIYGLNTVVMRQSCIYGEHQFGIEDQGWVAWMVISALLNIPFKIFGTGKQVRDILHVEDLYQAYISASQKIGQLSGQAFNIGGGPNHCSSVLEMWDTLGFKRSALKWEAARQGDQKVYVSDIRKAQKLLGWSPQISPASGIKQLEDWGRTNLEVIKRVLG